MKGMKLLKMKTKIMSMFLIVAIAVLVLTSCGSAPSSVVSNSAASSSTNINNVGSISSREQTLPTQEEFEEKWKLVVKDIYMDLYNYDIDNAPSEDEFLFLNDIPIMENEPLDIVKLNFISHINSISIIDADNIDIMANYFIVICNSKESYEVIYDSLLEKAENVQKGINKGPGQEDASLSESLSYTDLNVITAGKYPYVFYVNAFGAIQPNTSQIIDMLLFNIK